MLVTLGEIFECGWGLVQFDSAPDTAQIIDSRGDLVTMARVPADLAGSALGTKIELLLEGVTP